MGGAIQIDFSAFATLRVTLSSKSLHEAAQETLKSNQHCIIGVNANAVLGTHNMNDNAHFIQRHRVGVQSDICEQVALLLQLACLTVTNTMFRKRPEKRWTHRLQSTGEERQIDVAFVSPGLRAHLQDIQTFDMFGKSDHCPACVSLGPQPRSATIN